MRIVFMFECFTRNMGYATNMLPKYLADLGVEVHVVTTDLPNSYKISNFEKTYSDFIKNNTSSAKKEEHNGFTLHILPHKKVLGYVQMIGWLEKLEEIKPDIVQTFVAIGWIPLNAALGKILLSYKLCTGSHTTVSIFPLAQQSSKKLSKELLLSRITRALPGRMVSYFTEYCYAPTIDCAEVAIRFFGVEQEKVKYTSLGVDVEIFKPPLSANELEERFIFREKFNFSEHDIVCIYTGRFATDKNPLLLAKAIHKLRSMGKSFKGLFIGSGTQEEEIISYDACIVHPFVPVNELGKFFRCADIGVWPTQESTSMIDAAACGLPIIVNSTLAAVERIEGNGLTYKLNDLDDLAQVIQSLESSEQRKILGDRGAEKMAAQFSWQSLAEERLNDYKNIMSKYN